MIRLTIQHNIHLTRDQRYALHEGIEIVTVGVSVPVWFENNVTSEPGKEVFCRYYLKNPKKDLPVRILDNGYEITLPCRPGQKLEISDEEWRHLSFKEPDKLREMYNNLVHEASSKNLLDIRDGGSLGITYREHNKIKKGKEMMNIMHFINISTTEELVESIA
jgi:hypothetical protein